MDSYNKTIHDCYVETNSWTNTDTVGLPARGCHTMESINDCLLIFGGSSSFSPSLQHCETYHGDLLIATVYSQSTTGKSSYSCTLTFLSLCEV